MLSVSDRTTREKRSAATARVVNDLSAFVSCENRVLPGEGNGYYRRRARDRKRERAVASVKVRFTRSVLTSRLNAASRLFSPQRPDAIDYIVFAKRTGARSTK